MLATAPLAFGSSCAGASHAITLSQGSASPGSGTTATLFTFSVKYADSAGCKPSKVQVTVAGVGTYAMTGSGSNYVGGVKFTRGIRLPVGTHSYSFTASSGTGAGTRNATLGNVKPGAVVVSGTPSPTPQPTPSPTPRPTPRPTPVPTPQPTPASTPKATTTPTPAGSPTATHRPRPRHSPSPTPVGSGGAASGTPSPGPNGQGASSQSPAPGSGAGQTKGDGGGLPLMVVAWLTSTIGGLGLFVLLAPRRRSPLIPAAAAVVPVAEPFQAATSDQATQVAQSAEAAPPPRVSKDRDLDDEANMPRWLRPSVQAARHQGSRVSRRTRSY